MLYWAGRAQGYDLRRIGSATVRRPDRTVLRKGTVTSVQFSVVRSS
jgi:hypothetical protein